ncbi:MAG: T9SS type A sorting domain-containing protein, partial [Saprospiraceae bacterium]
IGTGEPVMWGDTLKYALIIYNQGNEGVKNVKVVDYLPLGLSFLSSNAPEWSLLSNGHAIATLSNSLAAGASDTLYINLGVKQGVRSDDLINYAEISYFENTEGDEDKDFDSTPDDDDDNDGDINDDNTNNDEGDEDDHDIVKAPLFDLALRKTVASGHNVVVIGDEVVYKIEIFNQGTMDATAVEVADFHQNGLTFDITLNPDWKPKGNHLEYIPTVDIKAGESAAIYITLKVNNNANNANILNEAEIIAAKDALGVNRSDFDIDSKPDTDFTNDIGGLAGSDTDNVINDIGIVDEDDHDVAPLMMCGDIACKGSINISVDNSCSFTITPSMLLTDTSGFLPSQFNIDYFDLNGNRITDVRINERINVMISVPVCTTGNTECWTQVLIEDKLAPILDCAERDTILCFEMDSIRYPKTLDLCDNGVKVELVNQQFIKLCQNDTIVGMSRRTFRAIDAAGNVSDTCSTDVYIMTPKIRNIQFPDDTIVACSGSFNDLNTLQKAKFGGPIFMGFDLTTDTLGICLIRSDFEDRVLINTPCKKQVMRMWTVRQTFCTNKDTIIQMPQLITLVDTLAPIISVADTIKVVGSTNANCMVTFSLPGLTAKDACDTNVVINVFHDSIPVFYNGMTLRLPIDTHTLYVQAYDGCHNISNDTFVVILQDDTAPVTICLAQTTVSLNNNGIATIPALKFDDGSYDACSNVTFSVRRMTSTCDTASLISGSSVIFCCDDVGSEVMVELTATDASGHTSICMISVEIQDKDIPSITCPPNVTVDCNYIIGDLTVFGNVVEQGQQKTLKIDPNDVVTASGSLADGVFFGNCMDTVLESSTKSIDQCGLGTITRIFTARTMSGIEANCNQTITIIHDGNTNKPLITYPNNITIVNCDAAAAAPTFAGFPTADEGKCNRIGFGYKDQLVTPLDTTITCLKIIRTWTAHETCVTPNKLISTGKQTIYLEKNQGNNLLIEGTVISRYDEPVSKVAVALRSRKNQSINQSDTDNKGQYVFDNMPQGGNYKVIPYKNHDWSNGVSTLDLIQIQNHILGKTPIIDGYNMIAADVNNDANVSAIDLVLLRKIILGIDDEVKNNTSWRFVWQDNDISDRLDLSSSLIEQYELDALIIDMSIDWVGIKVGDISGNAAANGIEKSESRSNEHYQMNWQISNVNDNDQIDFYLPTLLNFNGIQGEINIPKGLNIHAFKGGQIILNGENIHIDRVRNRIAYSYSSLTPLEIKRDKPLFSLIISGAAKLDEKSLTMGENITKAEVYTNLKSRSYKLEKKGNNNQAFEVFQNEPNPWKKNTAIIVNVPNNGDATFNVYDVQGRLLINRKVTLTKGKNTIYLDKKEISVTGVLLYEVTYNDKVVTNKMIRME